MDLRRRSRGRAADPAFLAGVPGDAGQSQFCRRDREDRPAQGHRVPVHLPLGRAFRGRRLGPHPGRLRQLLECRARFRGRPRHLRPPRDRRRLEGRWPAVGAKLMKKDAKTTQPTRWGDATKLVRGGLDRSPHGETSEDLFINSGFVYDEPETAERRFAGEDDGYVFGRYGNPTVSMFEERLRLLEGAEACYAVGSGMAAVFGALA